MERVVPLVLVFAASGCEVIDDLNDPRGSGAVDVEVEMRDGVPEISWNRGDAWTVEVRDCVEGECECLKGFYVGDGTEGFWTVGYDDKAANPVAEPPIQSPILYGEDVAGDQLHLLAQPLEPGHTYGVEVIVGGRELEGCTTFVTDE